MTMKLRVGHGYDLHRLVEGRSLILAGINIPHKLGLYGHSDADVVIHALIDSLVGATGLGDIGRLFPDSDPAYKGIDSQKLLLAAWEKITALEERWVIVNSSITIIAQKPKLASFIPMMEMNLEQILGLNSGTILIKAKTNEKVGPEGREEAISVHAVSLLQAD
jgi:2-C-methyl-D-erythritol 2,4-cyclodiphosphate synthase